MSPDPNIITFLFAIVSFGLAFGVKVNHANIKNLEAIISNLHTIYAKREDVEQDFQEIKATLLRIENKIDRKQDK